MKTNHLLTLETAIAKRDWNDGIMQTSGVREANAHGDTGRFLHESCQAEGRSGPETGMFGGGGVGDLPPPPSVCNMPQAENHPINWAEGRALHAADDGGKTLHQTAGASRRWEE